MLAPPCQPYTRQGLKKDAGDARAKSFVALLARIASMKHPPQALLIENVVGFESSITRQALKGLLEQNEYHFQEFILSPKDFGTPYSRPRYFCVARKKPLPVKKAFESPWTCPPRVLLDHLRCGQAEWDSSPEGSVPIKTLSQFMEQTPSDRIMDATNALSSTTVSRAESKTVTATDTGPDAAALPPQKQPRRDELAPQQSEPPGGTSGAPHTEPHEAGSRTGPDKPGSPAVAARPGSPAGAAEAPAGGVAGQTRLESSNGSQKPEAQSTRQCTWADFAVAEAAIEKSAQCIDIVTGDLHDANCFTKSYSKYAKGTGSVVATRNLHVLDSFPDWAHREEGGAPRYRAGDASATLDDCSSAESSISERMLQLGLRYFTPREVANLHAFPDTFSFPDHITLKQRYACLGNSLSVEVVASLLEYLFHDDHAFATVDKD
eukprot:jgi/Ulvmu1/8344/UM042_0050.1